jgi:WD40 repeat protein
MGHTSFINSIATSNSGEFFISSDSGKNDNIIIWDIKTAKEIKRFKGHTKAVNSIDISKDDKTFISGSSDGLVKLWDIKSAKALQTYSIKDERVKVVKFSLNQSYILVGTYENNIYLLDKKSGKTLRTYKGHTNGINSFVLLDDKSFLSTSFDGNIKLWDMDINKNGFLSKLNMFGDNKFEAKKSVNLKLGNISKIIKTSDKNIFVLASDKGVYLFDLNRFDKIKGLKSHKGNVDSISLSYDGKYLISGGGYKDESLKLWDFKSHKLLATLEKGQGNITDVKVLADGRYALSVSNHDNIKLWSLEDKKAIKSFSSYSKLISSLDVSKDGEHLVFNSHGNKENIWNLKKLKEKKYDGEYSIVSKISSDNRYIVSGSAFGRITIKDFKTQKSIKTFSGHKKGILDIFISNDNRYFVTSSKDALIKLWDIKSGKLLKTLKGHNGFVSYVYSVLITSDNRYIISSSGDNTIKVWDFKSGKDIKTLKDSSSIFSIDISSDNKYLVSAGLNSDIKLWDIKSGKLLKTLKGHNASVRSVVFSKDDKYIYSASEDNTIKKWDIKSTKLLKTLRSHTNHVISLGLSADGKYLYSGSRDGSIKLWDIKTDKELLSFYSFEKNEWIVISPQGHFNSSKNGAKYLNILVSDLEVVGIDRYYDKFYRPDILKKVLNDEKVVLKEDIRTITQTKKAPKVKILRVSEDMSKDERIKSTKKQYIYLTLKIDSKSGSIGDLRVYNNGIAVNSDNLRGLKIKNKPKYKKYKVYLKEGINKLSVELGNSDNSMKSIIDNYTLYADFKKKKTKTLYALIVGIEKFSAKEHNLRYSVNDAKTFAKLLEKVASKTYDKIEIKLLTKKDETTKQSIEKALKSYRKKTNQNDTFLFFGATHGFIDELDGKYYFITSDYDGELKNSIGKDSLVELLAKIKMQNKLVILDTCYSGEASEDMIEDLINPSIQKIANYGLSVYAGSGKKEEALEGYKGHGLFTYTLLEGLKNIKKIGNGDKKITVSELGSFIETQVPVYAEKVNFIQTPLFEKRGDNFELGKIK